MECEGPALYLQILPLNTILSQYDKIHEEFYFLEYTAMQPLKVS
jgi:hypothetical protein